MNLKKHVKLLVVFSIILLATLFLYSKSVQAMGATVKEGELTTELLDSVLPTSISLEIKETELDTAETLAYRKIEEVLATKGIKLQTSMSAPTFEVWFSFEGEDPNVHEVTVEWNGTYKKKIALKYTNTSNYNDADAKIIENLFPGKYGDTNVISIGTKLLELGESYSNFDKDFLAALNKKANDSTITFVPSYLYGKGGEFDFGFGGSQGYYVFKNDVYYKHIVAGFSYSTIITVPDDVEDTKEAYVNYALTKLESYLEKIGYNDICSISIKKVENKEDLYTVYVDGEALDSNITIRKAKVEEEPTTQTIKEIKIKDLPSTQEIKQEEIALDNSVPIIKEITKKAQELKLNVIGAIDVNVIDKVTGETINLTKSTNITLNVGEEYNGKFAYVIHQKHNGEYEYLKNVKITNGQLNITLTGLSPIVVAIQDGEIIDEKPDVKDDSPKTGVLDFSNYIIMIVVITGVGIIALRKKS